jgi:hypothetical protein
MEIFMVILAALLAGSYVYFMFFYLTSMAGSRPIRATQAKQVTPSQPTVSPANNIPIVVKMPAKKVLARDDREWGDTLEVPSYLRQEPKVRPQTVQPKPPKRKRRKTTEAKQSLSVDSGSTVVSSIDDMDQLELINNGNFELVI